MHAGSFFLSMRRQPPGSTLFPYTTLFRSWQQRLAPSSCGSALRVAVYTSECEPRDRKSTRLNSSHQIISYAVFCLKKKMHSRIGQVDGHYDGCAEAAVHFVQVVPAPGDEP